MPRIAFLFPGQGSQSVGMGKDLYENDPDARTLIEKSDGILGFSLSKLCFEGPEEDLKQTQNTQPALYMVSAAAFGILRKAGIQPMAVAGHSLGEYTALCAAGVFDYETGLKLVRTRGEAFAEAGSKRPGAMAAIIGLDNAKVAEICREAGSGSAVAVPANFNDPTQTVISGDPPAVEKACELCKEAGAKRALPLPVSGAFHSPLVAPAADTMRDALARADLKAPQCAFVNNVSAERVDAPSLISQGLVDQVTSSVRWVESVQKLVSLGAEAFVEVGSGKVLAGLARRIDRNVPVHTTESWSALQSAIDALKG